MSKNTFLLVVAGLLCTAVQGASLPIPGNGHTSQDLFYKESRAWRIHKACKISGWTAFGVGAPMMIAGFVGDVLANYERPSYKSYNPAFRIVGCVGTGLTAACIPLFAIAVKNRQKAENTALGTELGPKQWKKYRQFRITACTSLGVGLAGMFAGWAGGAFDDDVHSKSGWKAAFYSGATLTAASIPLFVLANRHKKAAQTGDVTVSLGSTTVRTVTTFGTLADKPALALQIRF